MPATSSHIFLTVTNDLSYDQRMQRIAGSLSGAGYQVSLIGRQLPTSLPLDQQHYRQHRIKCRYHSGKLFYLEYNWRLYRYLHQEITHLKKEGNQIAICAIDLDTILPCHRIAKKFGLPAVYDAHELFTELTEVKRRPLIHAAWLKVEQGVVPHFKYGYTVNQFIAGELERRYGVKYEVIRNMPKRSMVNGQWSMEETQTTDDRRQTTDGKLTVGRSQLIDLPPVIQSLTIQLTDQPFFLYQGAVNEGRSFETLIPAMKMVEAALVIAGEGNFFQQAKGITKENGLEDKVFFTGYLEPDKLRSLTPLAYAGITIFENTGLNQYYSLANRYFDYIQAGIPQVCVNYPEYTALNQQFETAVLVDDVSPETLASQMNLLLHDTVLYERLKANTIPAGKAFCWEEEEKRLLSYWETILPTTK